MSQADLCPQPQAPGCQHFAYLCLPPSSLSPTTSKTPSSFLHLPFHTEAVPQEVCGVSEDWLCVSCRESPGP